MRTRFLSLLLASGLLPFAVGCDELAKATDNKAKTEEKAKADSSAPADSPRKTKKSLADLADFSTTDPLIASAVQAREQLVEQEEDLLERLDELRALLATPKADSDRMRRSVDDFLEIAKEMRRITVQAGESINEMIETTDELARSTKHLAGSYRASAELFRKKARDYSEKKLRDQLLGFATDYEQIAKSIPERTRTLDAFQRKLPRLKVKVREANAFLDDVVLFLGSHPGIGPDPRDRYAGQFETFAVTFSEWLRTLDELRNGLRERAVSKVIQEGYRKDALAQQKVDEAKRDELARIERAKREELAQAEQARRNDEARLAQIKDEELRKANAERERPAMAEAGEKERANFPTPVNSDPRGTAMLGYPSPVVSSTDGCQSVAIQVTSCRTSVSCVRPQPCRIRLFPLFRFCR